jgi:hypothetical protein
MVALIGGMTALSAFAGGFLSHLFSGMTLKFIFSGFLVIAGFLMLLPKREYTNSPYGRRGCLRIRTIDGEYFINLWFVAPITLTTGFAAGMVGVSGGSFLVPLMVLACRLPMHIAVGTASTLVAVTALMGFLGHTYQGDFRPSWALTLAAAAIVGGIIGGKIAIKAKASILKLLFAFTTLAAAIFMAINAVMSK